jgi:hypothetical protein
MMGGFLPSPYLGDAELLARDFAAGAALDAADAAGEPSDEAPAVHIAGVREAIAAARFDLAADLLVAFANAEPGHPASGWALRRAYVYLRALGRDTAGVLCRYEAGHAAREPRPAARFFWQRRDESAPGPDREAHLRGYLARHARHGPPDLRIAAEAELAASLWRRSCATPLHGLCVAVVPTRREGACNPGELPLLRVLARAPTLRREALRRAAAAKRLGRALDLAEVAPWRRPALRTALGQAALVVADDALEALAALEHPRDLDFFVEDYKRGSGVPKWEREYREQRVRADDSQRRFTAYFRGSSRRAAAAMTAIEAVGATRSGAAIVPGMARLALVFTELGDEYELMAAPPKHFGPDVWCEPVEWYGSQYLSELWTGCAALVRATASPGPEAQLCLDGLGSHRSDDLLAEFTGERSAILAR